MEINNKKYTHTVIVGNIYTANEKDEFVESLVIEGNKIVFMGKIEETHGFIESKKIPFDKIKNIKLKLNHLVLPGFIDSHVHPLLGGLSKSTVDVSECSSTLEVVEKLREFYDNHPNLEFILAHGYYDIIYPKDDPAIHYSLLDTVSSEIPIVIRRYDCHAYWCNSALMKIADITKETESPLGGKIQVDKNGELVGVFHDNAMELVKKVMPKLDEEDKINVLLEVSNYLLSYGITSYMDAAVKYKNFHLFKKIYSDSKNIKNLPRCSLSMLIKSDFINPEKEEDEEFSMDNISIDTCLTNAEKFFNRYRIKDWENGFIFNNKFKVNTVKLFIDGVFESGTAMFSRCTCNNKKITETYGISNDELHRIVSFLYHNDIQIHTHCIGDLATKLIINTIESVSNKQPNIKNNQRNYIAHLQLVNLEDIKKMKALNIYGNMSPFWFKEDDFSTNLEELIGKERLNNIYPIRTFIENDVKIGFGSDWPVTTLNPLDGIEVAITHRNLGSSVGNPSYIPEHEINIYEAIKAYTINSAEILDLDKIVGSIEIGKLADLVIIDKNIFELNPNDIHTASVEMTILDGEIVYDKNSI